MQERRNAAAKEIGQAMARKDLGAPPNGSRPKSPSSRRRRPALEAAERDHSAALNEALSEIPNLPLDDVPVGADEHGNVEVRRFGERPSFPPKVSSPKEHFVLGEALGLMDFDTAAKLSGARFVVLRGAPGAPRAGARPVHARSAHRRSTATRRSTRRCWSATPPCSARRNCRSSATTSSAPARSYWLIPTAEVPLTNLVRERVLDEAQLPLRFTALTPCFRAEAGAAGRDTRGMIRQHQFDKVELVSITTPEASLAEHERMTACAEEVLKRLGLHYRVMLLCTGDMGFASRKTYDIEVWLPGQGAFREISSCSVCGDFQARRMEARYRPQGAKTPRFVHTLNGSGVAVGRALVAVLEHYQEPGRLDHGARGPVALHGGLRRIDAVKR